MHSTIATDIIEGGPSVHVLARVEHTAETQVVSIREGAQSHPGEKLVVRTRYGEDLAEVLGLVDPDDVGKSIEPYRPATESECEAHRSNNADADSALGICRELIARHGLDMTLVSAHYVLDRSRLVFFFCADQRVDFRELVKDLVHEFRVRIELRQIGVRDEARLLGGLGICGRVLCCNGVSDKLKAVSIKMAKTQNLSLNSMKISGPCGRLLCCPAYEYDFYRDSTKGLPNVGARAVWGTQTLRVTDVNVLTGMIRLEGDDRSIEVRAHEIQPSHVKHRWEVVRSAPQPEDCEPPETPPTS